MTKKLILIVLLISALGQQAQAVRLVNSKNNIQNARSIPQNELPVSLPEATPAPAPTPVAPAIALAPALPVVTPTKDTTLSFYVAPNGIGTNCSLSVPCQLITARDKVRGLTATMQQDITVYLRQGVYNLSKPLTLDERDSGRNGRYVIYKNYKSEVPVLSGGALIGGWKLVDRNKNIYSAPVGAFQFRQLYVNGVRAIRARSPNVTDTATGAPYLMAISANPFRVASSEIGRWSNLNQIEVVWLSHWHQKRARIASLNSVANSATATQITFTSPESTNTILNNAVQEGAPHYYENAYEFLDAEGEWYLNRSGQTLYYKPRAGESMATAQVIIPTLTTLLSIKGSSAISIAHHIQISGLAFMHSNWSEPSNYGYMSPQAALTISTKSYEAVPGAVWLSNVSNVQFLNNTIQDTGAHGLLMTGMVDRNQVVGNKLSMTSAGGIYSLSGESSTAKSTNELIANNLVEKVGRDYTDAVGILATLPSQMTIKNNVVRQTPYTGISIGWNWTDKNLGANTNVVQSNYIQQVMQLHDDGAGIYSLGYQANTIISGNYITDVIPSVYNGKYPIAGIYLDNGSSYVRVIANVLNNSTAAFYAKNAPNHDNLISQNYYSVPLGQIHNLNKATNNVSVTGKSWPQEALALIFQAGVIGQK